MGMYTAEELYSSRYPFHMMSTEQQLALANSAIVTDTEYFTVLINSNVSSIHEALSGREDIWTDSAHYNHALRVWSNYRGSHKALIAASMTHYKGDIQRIVSDLENCENRESLISVLLRSDWVTADLWVTILTKFVKRASYTVMKEQLAEPMIIDALSDTSNVITSEVLDALVLDNDTMLELVYYVCSSTSSNIDAVEHLLLKYGTAKDRNWALRACDKNYYLTPKVRGKIVDRIIEDSLLSSDSDNDIVRVLYNSLWNLNYVEALSSEDFIDFLERVGEPFFERIDSEIGADYEDNIYAPIVKEVYLNRICESVDSKKLCNSWIFKIFKTFITERRRVRKLV